MLSTVANMVFLHLAMIDRPSTLTHAWFWHCYSADVTSCNAFNILIHILFHQQPQLSAIPLYWFVFHLVPGSVSDVNHSVVISGKETLVKITFEVSQFVSVTYINCTNYWWCCIRSFVAVHMWQLPWIVCLLSFLLVLRKCFSLVLSTLLISVVPCI